MNGKLFKNPLLAIIRLLRLPLHTSKEPLCVEYYVRSYQAPHLSPRDDYRRPILHYNSCYIVPLSAHTAIPIGCLLEDVHIWPKYHYASSHRHTIEELRYRHPFSHRSFYCSLRHTYQGLPSRCAYACYFHRCRQVTIPALSIAVLPFCHTLCTPLPGRAI